MRLSAFCRVCETTDTRFWLVSELNAASLNNAISDALGDGGIMYFSSILSSSTCDLR